MPELPTELEVEVFRTGDFADRGTFSEQDLDAIADDYNAGGHEAPVTLDHEQSGPAHGWVAGLRRLGDRLLARLTRLSPQLAGALRSGAFRKRSIELYRAWPATGRRHLKAVSFLGAAAPVVKGLRDPVFSGDAELETDRFSEELRDPRTEARDRLIERRAWNPAWEQAGLLDVFAELDGTPQADALLRFCESLGAPVTLGESPRRAAPAGAHAFAESLAGVAEPDSLGRHRQALALLEADPELGYRDALLRTH